MLLTAKPSLQSKKHFLTDMVVMHHKAAPVSAAFRFWPISKVALCMQQLHSTRLTGVWIFSYFFSHLLTTNSFLAISLPVSSHSVSLPIAGPFLCFFISSFFHIYLLCVYPFAWVCRDGVLTCYMCRDQRTACGVGNNFPPCGSPNQAFVGTLGWNETFVELKGRGGYGGLHLQSNPSMRKAKAGESLQGEGQPELQNQSRLGFLFCL